MFTKVCLFLLSVLVFASAHYVVPWEKTTNNEDDEQKLQLLDVNGIIKILDDVMSHLMQEEAYGDREEFDLTLKEVWGKYGAAAKESISKGILEKETSFFESISRKIEDLYSENQQDERLFEDYVQSLTDNKNV